MYWRTSTNIDFDIYYHIIPHCVEVIPFDSDKGKELNRLYFNYEKLLQNVEQNVVENMQKKRKELLENLAKDRFSSTTENATFDEVLLEESRQLAISSFLLNRLQLNVTPASNIVFNSTGSDNAEYHPLLAQVPVSLVPVQVNRRRKTSTEEITNTLSGFQADYADLKAATAKAEKISNLVFEGANMLTSLGKFSKDDNVSKWAKLWRWAIRLIIRRKHVALMTIVIADWEKKMADKKAVTDAAKPLTVAEKRMSVVTSTNKGGKTRRSFDGKL